MNVIAACDTAWPTAVVYIAFFTMAVFLAWTFDR